MYAARILHHFGTPEGAYFAGREELQACPGLPEKVRQALEDKDLSQADQILAQCEALTPPPSGGRCGAAAGWCRCWAAALT